MHFSELCVVLMVALLVFNPKKLPELAQTLGRFLRQAKLYSEAIKSEIHSHWEPIGKQIQLEENKARAEQAENNNK